MLSDLANIATIVGVITDILVFAWGLWTFRRDSALRRAEHFARIRAGFVTTPQLSRTLQLLNADSSELAAEDATNKRILICLLEEVALLLRAELLKTELAYYMFGYAAIRCADSNHLWGADFKKNKEYWRVFFDFAEDMRQVEKRKQNGTWDPEDVRL
jgi:hypothetical protein